MKKTELIKLLKSPLIPDDTEVYFFDGITSYRRVDDVRLKQCPDGSTNQVVILRPLQDLFINK